MTHTMKTTSHPGLHLAARLSLYAASALGLALGPAHATPAKKAAAAQPAVRTAAKAPAPAAAAAEAVAARVPTLRHEIDTPAYQGAERRSPNRAANVVRPAFAAAPAARPAAAETPAPQGARSGTDDDWETF